MAKSVRNTNRYWSQAYDFRRGIGQKSAKDSSAEMEATDLFTLKFVLDSIPFSFRTFQLGSMKRRNATTVENLFGSVKGLLSDIADSCRGSKQIHTIITCLIRSQMEAKV